MARQRISLPLPKVMLWAWERPEDLSYIDPKRVGVAYLAQTITLSGPRLNIRPRVQALKLPAGAAVEAVTRIEVDTRETAAYSQKQLEGIVESIAAIASRAPVRAVQIDFDAVETERPFYARLLTALRARLPESLPISITALASWCLYDSWMANLPIDEAVPMMFQMGRDHAKVLLHIKTGRKYVNDIYNESLGVSLSEPQTNLIMKSLLQRQRDEGKQPRVYIFSPARWTKEEAARAVQFGDVQPGE